MAAKNEIYDVPLTTYECETIEDACIASLHFLITHECNILKCQNCGKYFISERSDAKYCDRISPFNTNATCKIDGAQRTHRKHSNEDVLKKKITTTRNKLSQRCRRNNNDPELYKKYDTFLDTLSIKKKEQKSGVITEDQLLEWLEQY